MAKKIEPDIIIGNFIIEMLQRNINAVSKEYLYYYIAECNTLCSDEFDIMADDRHLLDFFKEHYPNLGRLVKDSITLTNYPIEKVRLKFRSNIPNSLAMAFRETGKAILESA